MAVSKETNCLWILYEMKTSYQLVSPFLKSSEVSKNKYNTIIWTFIFVVPCIVILGCRNNSGKMQHYVDIYLLPERASIAPMIRSA